jgi:dTDP-4-amino-4,6-dideoxy-D-glucose acyltransferase
MISSWYSKEELKCLGHVGENVLIDHSVVLICPENIYIGSNVRVDAFCMLSGTQGIRIGNQVHIAPYCQLVSAGGIITMEDFSGLSARVSIFTASDDYVGGTLTNPTVPDRFKKLKTGPVVLEKHVIIGCGSVIMPNCTLGFGSSVGALSFVGKSVKSGDVVSGQPAKTLTTRNLNKLRESETEYYNNMNLGANNG